MSIDINADKQAADAGMSTAPQPDKYDAGQSALGARGWLRWMWRQLTSMRVALILLLLLSLAAIPSSLIPQRSVSPFKVSEYFRNNPGKAEFYDKLQLFDVFSSWWFAAIYILLFVSLVGCIVPRAWAHSKALRTKPPAAPRNMERLPAYATWETDADAADVLAAARVQLKKRRFRLAPSTDSLAGEKGYMRETGNIVFHIALIGVLLAFLVGKLFMGQGGKILVEGSPEGFANSFTQYDDFQSGALFDEKEMEAFGFKLKKLDQTFERLGTQKGAPRDFEATVEYWQGVDGKPKTGKIKVNEPLQIGGTKVFLLGTGYALDITVKDSKGKVAYQGPVVFLPQDSNRTSTGVIKVPDVSRGVQQIGFDGIFAPTVSLDPNKGWFSTFPSLDSPALILTAYHGSLGIDTGVPQSVFRLNTKAMEQYKKDDGQPWAQVLRPGETEVLPDGSSITLDGVRPWANFQISKEPGKEVALYSVIAAITGLVLSLFVRRRRMWVRATAGPDGRTVVEVAGLTRTEGGGLGQEVQALVDDLRASAPVASSDGPASGAAPKSAEAEGAAKSVAADKKDED
ncbi:cytochrome c biogenesis protein ResB [Yinghuangia soli]|uniref:Cytochrome c biogenesis protein ResB n=1 Tax=Yinghuangia soli TaxID=2908204 RepID=A0AA41Q2G6_9ACTN|nr:cytochrome c biogenesis protein ResB [Yinghuangia soli]MCF2529506.1 cytochrome c biogenesis protein ResB [Yinghuangia soli]